MMSLPSTQLVWAQRQRSLKVNLKWIQACVEKAVPLCLEQLRWPESRLPDVVEITLLSDRAITKIHADFLDDPTPTDVITFGHSAEIGEILIGVPTVAEHAKTFHQALDHEIVRCAVHGLLHLLDYDDMTPEEHTRMHAYQEAILEKILPSLP